MRLSAKRQELAANRPSIAGPPAEVAAGVTTSGEVRGAAHAKLCIAPVLSSSVHWLAT